ncbi:MAG: zinc ABC transporter substrate-binding protein [Allgaiera sp.]|jgi:zinc transport system substrate-binding protein|nr:zinc ABC transporter substrate-binding protein [Allgaiera sp.]
MTFYPFRGLVAAMTLALMGAQAQAEVPRVVTDIPPVESLVAQVMGDLGRPEVLTGKGADPHNLQLRPSQAVALAQADLVFWIGPELTPWLARALQGSGDKAKTVALLHLPGTRTLDYSAGQGDPAAAQDDHDHGALNPHAWLDPDNARLWLTVIAADLAQADPAHAAEYRANAKVAEAAVARADARARQILAPVGAHPIIVYHDALGYFARHYGLNLAGSISLGDAATPGARRLADIRALLARGGAVCVFPEAGVDPRLVQTVAQGTRAKIGAPLDPPGTMLARGPKLYERLIDGMAQKIADCAG